MENDMTNTTTTTTTRTLHTLRASDAEVAALRAIGKPVPCVRVLRDREWGEYLCVLTLDDIEQPRATYHTDDRRDAIATAFAMSEHHLKAVAAVVIG